MSKLNCALFVGDGIFRSSLCCAFCLPLNATSKLFAYVKSDIALVHPNAERAAVLGVL
jgi:hypothetical protein